MFFLFNSKKNNLNTYKRKKNTIKFKILKSNSYKIESLLS